MRNDLKQALISLVDRRTIVTILVVILLFLLAYKKEKTEAIEAITWVSIALIGSNAAQRSLIAFSRTKKKEK